MTDDATWERALNCACSQFESYVRRDELRTLEQRRIALNDALQHAVGIIELGRANGDRTRGVELERVGFVIRELADGRKVGCSPDRFVGSDGVLETKTMRPDLLIDLALKGAAGFPSEHRAQCQGILWVTGRLWLDLKLFYRRMPVSPTFKIFRDEVYIRELAEAIEVFDYDLQQLVKKIRAMGGGR